MQTFCVCLYMCCCFQILLHWYAAFPFHPPTTSPLTMKCRNRLISKYATMPLYSALVSGVWVWLGSQEPLPERWMAECTIGGRVVGGRRGGRQNRGQPFPLHLFPCTIQALWSCWKTSFLHHFVWLYNHRWTSLSALPNNKGSEVPFFFNWKIILLSDLSFN